MPKVPSGRVPCLDGVVGNIPGQLGGRWGTVRRLWCQLRCKAQGVEPMGAADLNSTEEGLGVD